MADVVLTIGGVLFGLLCIAGAWARDGWDAGGERLAKSLAEDGRGE